MKTNQAPLRQVIPVDKVQIDMRTMNEGHLGIFYEMGNAVKNSNNPQNI